jgi:hypothetical protein
LHRIFHFVFDIRMRKLIIQPITISTKMIYICKFLGVSIFWLWASWFVNQTNQHVWPNWKICDEKYIYTCMKKQIDYIWGYSVKIVQNTLTTSFFSRVHFMTWGHIFASLWCLTPLSTIVQLYRAWRCSNMPTQTRKRSI